MCNFIKKYLNFFPIITFFIFYKLYDIYWASATIIIATILGLIFTWIKYQEVNKISLLNFIMVFGCSSLTLIFHNDIFIKWKVTVIYTLISFSLIISQFIFKKPLIRHILGKKIIIPIKILNNINIFWAIFFLGCSITNVYIAFWLPQSTWVNFKVFYLNILTLIFSFITSFYVYFSSKKSNRFMFF
ncbi:putative intracellular septation protein A [Candidatus Ecksteinia adelgidicola]|nr:putative intracellular septation protein A [Candidatus Ecksteinia adelgidicola]